MRTVTLCIALGALSCLTNSAHSNDIPEGKIYSYKEEDGVTREMEIHFPRRTCGSHRIVSTGNKDV